MKTALITASILGAMTFAACSGGIVGGECRASYCAEKSDASTDGATGDAPADRMNHDARDGADKDAAEGGDGGPTEDAADATVDVITCTPPLVNCGGVCVDTQTDPENCGTCFNACPSGICQAGVCVGATTGHIVLACMSFEQNSQSSPQTTLLANSVFLPFGDPVRILGYAENTPNAISNKVNQALGWAATAKGRNYTLTPAPNAAAIPSTLTKASFDVLLVYDQTNAAPGALGPIGTSWATTLAPFVQAGGVVLVLTGGAGAGEMDDLITNAGLLTVTDQPLATGSVVYNQAPLDAVGLNVLSPYLAQKRTCTFTTPTPPSASLVFVVTNAAPDAGPGSPVVVHGIP